jgi:hypothetical protein
MPMEKGCGCGTKKAVKPAKKTVKKAAKQK